MSNASDLPVARANPLESLYSKVSVLMTGQVVLGTLGALASPHLNPVIHVLLAIVWFLLTIPVIFLAVGARVRKEAFGKDTPPFIALTVTAVWTLLSGIIGGPALHLYRAELGTDLVVQIALGCCLAAAICGAYGFFSKRNFSSLAGILSIALWGIILVSFIGVFFYLSPVANMWISGLAVVVFLGYFIVDFNRLAMEKAAGANDWGTAIYMSVLLYLDLLNVVYEAWRFALAYLKGK